MRLRETTYEREVILYGKNNTGHAVSSISNALRGAYGVARASRRYDKAPSYIYFWRKRWDGSIESLREKSRRPHHHPNEHTETELKLIRNMRRRNPKLGVVELWHRLRKRGYTRHVYSLYRVLHRLDMLPAAKGKRKYVAKPYQQMTHPGERIV